MGITSGERRDLPAGTGGGALAQVDRLLPSTRSGEGPDVDGDGRHGAVDLLRRRGVRRGSVVAGLAILGSRFLAACDPIVLTCANWIGPSGGNWGIASNWDTGKVPGA